MAVSKKLKSFYMNFWDTPELWAANTISNYQERKYLKRYLNRKCKLTAEQRKQIKEFWKPYKSISPKWAQYYSAMNGKFDPRYIPNDLYYTKIDQHFNSRKLGYGFNDKNYYSKIFAGIKQPEVIVRKINGLLFDAEYAQLTVEQAKALITAVDEVICKPSQETGSGRGIEFFRAGDQDKINAFLTDPSYDDYIVQKLIEQHPDIAKVHPDSVNTVRICSILMDDGVYILSSCLRMGTGSSRVDNVTAGGISCGIKPDGYLDKYSYTYYTGEKRETHPSSGVRYEGFSVPSYDKAVALVKRAHPLIGHFRLVSWDIAIDRDGDAMLIEANMRKGGINLHQFDNGPLFGDLTERVLNEVFKK
ncbi:MAG: hypothetical protein E7637_05560 [Ruminococcaceae bacterium]|nr:hypothetical protein [Oscillospiraceae bacterium]